LEYPEETPDNA